MEITLDKNGSLYDPAGTESTCRWRKTEEGYDAGNTNCGNRVDSKQRSVTAWSTVQTEFCRYKWLIRPLIHRNAIASLDWIGKSAPVPLH